MTKLSLIIPIYKVENYIIECLESVCCQLVEGVEVILVNDGTPDNSMIMARKYISEKYDHLVNQFVFIDQENQGLSGARNTGLINAKGDYVWFVDSDDTLEENAIVKAFFDNDPTNSWKAKVKYISYKPELTEQNVLSYKIIAQFDDINENGYIPSIGLRGTAKIYSKQVSLFFYLFRKPITATRQWIGW